jgi:uncharacterized protein (DUF1330 family)
MAAYVIADVARITDPQRYDQYKAGVPKSLSNAGAQYLARGGAIHVLEGNWKPNRLVLVRFDNTELARAWWASNEYAELKRLRQESTDTNLLIVTGVDEVNQP